MPVVIFGAVSFKEHDNNLEFVTGSNVFSGLLILTATGVAMATVALLGMVPCLFKWKLFSGIVSEPTLCLNHFYRPSQTIAACIFIPLITVMSWLPFSV